MFKVTYTKAKKQNVKQFENKGEALAFKAGLKVSGVKASLTGIKSTAKKSVVKKTTPAVSKKVKTSKVVKKN